MTFAQIYQWKMSAIHCFKTIRVKIHIYVPLTLDPRRYPKTTFYQNDLAIRNAADVTGGKPV
jgi:hypothetical protein